MRRASAEHRDRQEAESNKVTGSLAGMALALLLVVVGLLLVHALVSEAKVEDCLLSGRTNCDQLLPP